MGLLDVALRASLVVAAALAASAALGRHSAALRHWVLAAGIFSAAAVIPFGLGLPRWDLPFAAQTAAEAPLPAGALVNATSSEVARPIPSPWAPAGKLAAGLWGTGIAVSVLLMLMRFRRLVRLTQRSSPIVEPRWLECRRALSVRDGVGPGVALLRTDTPDVLATWGVRRPCVLLPSHAESWSDARIHVVLSHELAHIRRADWAIQIAAEVVRAAFWFNPLFTFACARLRRESELACDDAVLDAGVPPADYASHLVEIARTCRPSSPDWAAALPIARPSTLEWRITSMMNPATLHRRPSRRVLALSLAALVAVAVPVATGRMSAQSEPRPLQGSVYDVSAGVLPQVAVTLEDASGLTQQATTDASGHFEFDAVEPGVYTISTALPGFLTLRQEVTLREARQWQRAITLQVGTVQERITVRDDRPADAPSAPTAGTEPLRVGGNIRPPRKLVDVRPVYPPAMRDGGFEGVVPMQVQIGTDGSVSFVRVNSAHVHPELAQAAVDAVRQWRFSPTLLNGVEVEVFMTVSVQFSLQD